MSLQVFLEARLLGAEEFLSQPSLHLNRNDSLAALMGRCAWLTLYCEALSRALLAQAKLSRMLLGSSSAEQFLLVLPEEEIGRANEFLSRAAAGVAALSNNSLKLIWASTENLGAWQVARKRLDDALDTFLAAPLAAGSAEDIFRPFAQPPQTATDYFAEFGRGLVSASSVSWSRNEPASLAWNEGEFSWKLADQTEPGEDSILFPRRIAMREDDSGEPAGLAELGARSEGSARWGILRGDVDHFENQLKRGNSVEDYLQFSAVFKEFFAGELALLCTLPDFWRKVTLLYRGGDDFAVAGSWDALVLLSRELQRVFEKFVEHHFSQAPGVEAKTVSMALVLAPEQDADPALVFAEAGSQLRRTKAEELGSIALFGRTLEWKRLADAEELKTGLVRLVREGRSSPAYLNDLAAVYRETPVLREGRKGKAVRLDKPWRTYMRLSRVIPHARGKELLNVRNTVITNLIGKRTAGLKLRASGRVGLEWARLAANI